MSAHSILNRLRPADRHLGRRAGVVALVLTVLTVLAGTSAWAFWSSFGTGTGSAQTGTLNAPTSVSASSIAGSGKATVSWAAPEGTAPTGYYVRRTRTSDSTTAFACGSTATTFVTSPCNDTAVPDGTYTYVVTAVLNSWTTAGAVSNPVEVTNAVGTSTQVTSNANPSVVGQTVTYTATVTPDSGSATPGGTVSFNDGASPVNCDNAGGRTLSGGQATCQVTYAGVGTHSITAVYDDHPGFTGSTSSELTQTVNKAGTTTGLTSSEKPSKAGQTVTYTATVAAVSPGTGTPTGTVTFKDGTSTISCDSGSQTLNGSGTATCSLAYATVGSHSINAVYAGSSAYDGSTSDAMVQAVNQADTTTSVSSSAIASKVGQTVTFTATVDVVAPGSGTPTGTVTFKSGAYAISCGAGSSTTLNASRQATCQTSFAATGDRSITAVYDGDANFAASTTSSLAQTVNKSDTIMGLTSSSNPSKAGQTVTFTATVDVTSPGAGTATGSVTFKDGTTTISCAAGSSITLSASRQATCLVAYATMGNHSITAVYSGDANYNTSTSSPLTQRVVNAGVTGIVFTGVTGGSASPVCTGAGTATYTCTISGGNNAAVSAQVRFVDSSGTATVYSPDNTNLSWASTGKNAGNGTLVIAGGTATSAGTVMATKSGVNAAQFTVTLNDGVNTFTATMQISGN
jgi:hypothetical protein